MISNLDGLRKQIALFQSGGSTAVRRALVAFVAALPLIAAGCGEHEVPPVSRRGIKVSELPEGVLGAAKKALPEIKFEEAWQNLDRDGKLTSYEVRGRASTGKIREVRVSTSGEILEMD